MIGSLTLSFLLALLSSLRYHHLTPPVPTRDSVARVSEMPSRVYEVGL